MSISFSGLVQLLFFLIKMNFNRPAMADFVYNVIKIE